MIRTGGMCGYGLDQGGSGYGQVGCVVMDSIELAQYTDCWDVRLWTGSRWLRIRTGEMCGYGLDRAGSGYEQEGCAVMDWIELAQNKNRWDERLWT